MSRELSALHPSFRPFAQAFVRAVIDAGIPFKVTSTFRSRLEQEGLYRRYVSGRSRFPAARPGTSTHELGLAFDAVPDPYDALPVLGRIWEDLKLGRWGGRFRDPVHFEAPVALVREARGDLPSVPGRTVRRTTQAERMAASVGLGFTAEDVGKTMEYVAPWYVTVAKWILK